MIPPLAFGRSYAFTSDELLTSRTDDGSSTVASIVAAGVEELYRLLLAVVEVKTGGPPPSGMHEAIMGMVMMPGKSSIGAKVRVSSHNGRNHANGHGACAVCLKPIPPTLTSRQPSPTYIPTHI